jgi:hypothetical protein
LALPLGGRLRPLKNRFVREKKKLKINKINKASATFFTKE